MKGENYTYIKLRVKLVKDADLKNARSMSNIHQFLHEDLNHVVKQQS